MVRVKAHFEQQCLNPFQHLFDDFVIDKPGYPPGAFLLHPATNFGLVFMQHDDTKSQGLRKNILMAAVLGKNFQRLASKWRQRNRLHISLTNPADKLAHLGLADRSHYPGKRL